MKKRIFFTFLGLLVVAGVLGGIKGLQINRMIAQGKQFAPPPETVTTATAKSEAWESLLSSVGSLVAVQGVTVAAELTGKVVNIAFEPGTMVKQGDLLVQQDTTSEQAQLDAALATASLAKINLDRSIELLAKKAISRSDYDNADAQYKQAMAQADAIRTVIAKKTIRAPFTGQLGIRQVNLGQILNEGQAIVSLQSLDPIYVNFLLPQQQLALVRLGLAVRLRNASLTDQVIEGKITAINPQVDPATRNIQIQATVANSKKILRPGMFVDVTVVLPARENVLAIPATSVLYAPYSDSVFIVEQAPPAAAGGRPRKVIRQQFVRLGEKRGDFIAVTSGLKKGDVIVSTGVFKLRNGQAVVVDNTLAPEFSLHPQPEQS
jgi:membrane fusion protein (multidrug efflux system)